MEHWLPYLYEKMDTLFDYLPVAPVVIDHLVDVGVGDRLDQVRDHYEARRDAADKGAVAGSVPYKPIPPDALYLTLEEWRSRLHERRHARLSPFVEPQEGGPAIDMGGRTGRTFAAERAAGDVNVFDALVQHIGVLHEAGARCCLPPGAKGARDRLGQVLDGSRSRSG